MMETQTENRPALNGATLIGAFRQLSGYWTVFVDRGEDTETGRYVVATADHIDSPTWYWGHYFERYASAVSYFKNVVDS